MKILHFENDEFLTEMYRRKFTKLGWDYVFVNGIKDFKKYIDREKPDIIMLGIIFSDGSNGYKALASVKNDPEISTIPKVVLTNLSQKADVDRSLKLGAERHINMADYTPQEVVDMVHEIAKKTTYRNQDMTILAIQGDQYWKHVQLFTDKKYQPFKEGKIRNTKIITHQHPLFLDTDKDLVQSIKPDIIILSYVVPGQDLDRSLKYMKDAGLNIPVLVASYFGPQKATKDFIDEYDFVKDYTSTLDPLELIDIAAEIVAEKDNYEVRFWGMGGMYFGARAQFYGHYLDKKPFVLKLKRFFAKKK